MGVLMLAVGRYDADLETLLPGVTERFAVAVGKATNFYKTATAGAVLPAAADEEPPPAVVAGSKEVPDVCKNMLKPYKGDLFGSFAVTPQVFTPNSDDINDTAGISYDILAVTRPTDVEVKVFDLTGRQVRTLYQGADLSGHYDARTVSKLAWDGRDDTGAMVPPGLYLISLLVDGDARQTHRARTVGVAY